MRCPSHPISLLGDLDHGDWRLGGEPIDVAVKKGVEDQVAYHEYANTLHLGDQGGRAGARFHATQCCTRMRPWQLPSTLTSLANGQPDDVVERSR